MPSAGNKVRASDFDDALAPNTDAFAGMRFETGTVTVTVTSGGSYFTQAVSFDGTFDSAPVVAVGFKQGNGGAIAAIGGVVDSITTTGFTAYVRSGDDGNFGGTANYEMGWIAVG